MSYIGILDSIFSFKVTSNGNVCDGDNHSGAIKSDEVLDKGAEEEVVLICSKYIFPFQT